MGAENTPVDERMLVKRARKVKQNREFLDKSLRNLVYVGHS